tara:strand:- start:37 stop:747 length:711 start_codon:yes stop_codon:yes gene_type:complete
MKDYDVLNPFGPMVYRTDLSEDFHDFLIGGLSNSKTMGEDARQHLVGNIEAQRQSGSIYPEDKFVKFIDPHVINYVTERHERHNSVRRLCNLPETPWRPEKSEIRYDLNLGPWVNFQRKHEFNPLHNHAGIFSAIIFIDIPDEIEHERERSTFNAKANGCLELFHMNQHLIVKPKSGVMFLFPAYLWHSVYPFTSDVERVTMSFNIHNLIIDGELITPFDDLVFYNRADPESTELD